MVYRGPFAILAGTPLSGEALAWRPRQLACHSHAARMRLARATLWRRSDRCCGRISHAPPLLAPCLAGILGAGRRRLSALLGHRAGTARGSSGIARGSSAATRRAPPGAAQAQLACRSGAARVHAWVAPNKEMIFVTQGSAAYRFLAESGEERRLLDTGMWCAEVALWMEWRFPLLLLNPCATLSALVAWTVVGLRWQRRFCQRNRCCTELCRCVRLPRHQCHWRVAF